MNWTLRKKILLGYGLVLLLLAAVVGWSFANLLHLGSAANSILSENYRSIRAADRMIRSLERQDSGVLLYLLGYEEEGLEQYRTYQVEFAQWLGRAKANVTIEGEAEVIARIDSAYAAYLRAFAQVRRGGVVPDSAYRNQILPAFLQARRASDRLRLLNKQAMVQAGDRARAVARRAMWSVGGIGLGALALGLIFSLVLSNRLVRPIKRMHLAARRIADGDYDVEVPVGASDELGRLAEQFNDMARQLRAYEAMNLERIAAEQRKSETIIQSIDDGLMAIDTDFEVVNMNPAAARAFDTDAHAVRGRHLLEVVGSEQLFDYVRQTITSGRSPSFEREEDFLRVKRNGTTHHYQFNLTPFYGSSEHLLGVVVLLRDVTKLRELDRLKSEFVATASHELKTPLTSIGMGIGLLQEELDGQLDERAAELLSVTREDVGRLRTLVEDLLDLSKIESGRIELSFAPTPVPLLFEKAMQTLRAQASAQAIELTAATPEELPPVQAEANKITWVLTNLISNAIRYVDPGGEIHIDAERAGAYVEIAVEDNGAGIPYEYQSKIFDKFVQLDSKEGAGGSGLGLAICKEIIRAHGGTIWVDSTPGEGSTFTFTLSVAESGKFLSA